MKKYTFLILLLLATLACRASTLTETFTPSGGILYQDQFADPASGWDSQPLEPGAVGYAEGTYRISVNQPEVNLWSRPGLNFSAVHTEVDVFPAAGPLENRMGVICRLVDEQNFYFFIISADGYYGIGKMKAGQSTLLTGDGQMLPGAAIQAGRLPNRVRGDCAGKLLNMYINNQLVASVEDGDFSSGDVGLLAGTFSQPGIEIHFDNFLVFKP